MSGLEISDFFKTRIKNLPNYTDSMSTATPLEFHYARKEYKIWKMQGIEGFSNERLQKEWNALEKALLLYDNIAQCSVNSIDQHIDIVVWRELSVEEKKSFELSCAASKMKRRDLETMYQLARNEMGEDKPDKLIDGRPAYLFPNWWEFQLVALFKEGEKEAD